MASEIPRKKRSCVCSAEAESARGWLKSVASPASVQKAFRPPKSISVNNRTEFASKATGSLDLLQPSATNISSEFDRCLSH